MPLKCIWNAENQTENAESSLRGVKLKRDPDALELVERRRIKSEGPLGPQL